MGQTERPVSRDEVQDHVTRRSGSVYDQERQTFEKEAGQTDWEQRRKSKGKFVMKEIFRKGLNGSFYSKTRG